MLTAVEALEVLLKHEIILKKQLVSFGNDGKELLLSSISEPQNQKIQAFLGCRLVSAELTGCSVKGNVYTYTDFHYSHADSEHPYTLLISVVLHTPFGLSTRKNTLHYFDENTLFEKGEAYVQSCALLALADELCGVFIKTPYAMDWEALNTPSNEIKDSRKELPLKELVASKETGDLNDYRFYFVPHRVIFEIESIEMISSQKEEFASEYLDCFYHNTKAA